jgi:hypothetical protein
MITVVALAVAAVLLVLLARDLVTLVSEARGLDARNRRIGLITFIAVILGCVAGLVIVHSAKLGCLQWRVWVESCPRS